MGRDARGVTGGGGVVRKTVLNNILTIDQQRYFKDKTESRNRISKTRQRK